MVYQRFKNKIFKSKHIFTNNGTSANNIQVCELKVDRNPGTCQRDEVDSQHLLKYFLIGIGFVVFSFWLSITSVYFMDNPIIERPDLHDIRRQEVTYQLKNETASDVDHMYRRSGRECVTRDGFFCEGDVLNNTLKQIKIGINIHVVKKELRRLLSTREYKEISKDKPFLAANKRENRTKLENGENKKYCSRLLSEKKLFSRVLFALESIILRPNLHSKNLDSNINLENIVKRKPEEEKKTRGTRNEPKKKNKSKKIKTKKMNLKSQKENLRCEIRNFRRTFQRTFVPNRISANQRRMVPIELIPQKPNNSSVRVFMFEGFLSEYQCDNLRRVHDKHINLMSKEDPILCFDSIKTLQLHLKSAGKGHISVSQRDFTKDTTCVNKTFSSQLKKWLKANWSYSTAFYPGENYFSKIYEQRIQQAMGLNPENGGKFQITSYPRGIGYKRHTDCIENSSDGRDRMATVLVYLDTVKKGGETRFPELGISVQPRKGRALVWNNMDEDGKCESMSTHVAERVTNGHKYILQRWYYYQSFYTLGKRPPQTDTPRRNGGQARVSCDEYAHGSCRWYDEWNHDHLIEYHENKAIKI